MRTKLKFTRFKHQKEIDELEYEVSHWTTDLEFIKLELDFINHLLKFYPFKKNIINLFERLQIYIQKIDALHKENSTISKNLQAYELLLNRMKTDQNHGKVQTDTTRHDNLAESVYEYKQGYVAFKTEVYEYIDGIIK